MPEINTEYVIELYHSSKHVGGIRHIAFYTCGFWRGLDGNLIALHSDVKSWNPLNTASSPTAPASPACGDTGDNRRGGLCPGRWEEA